MSETDAVEEAATAVRARRAAGERIVLTNGCFDLLHPGHVESLRRARALGDCLVVAVNSDDSVRRLKGPGRPILKLADRVELLLALRFVDLVVPFESDTPLRVVQQLQPDVWVKGADWRDAALPEADAVRQAGGEVVYLDLVPGHSTTTIIERVRGLAPGSGPLKSGA